MNPILGIISHYANYAATNQIPVSLCIFTDVIIILHVIFDIM